MIKALLLTILFCTFSSTSTKASALAIEGMTAVGGLTVLRSEVDKTIDKAERTGDALLWRMAISIRDAIDEWERANKAILDHTLTRAFLESDKVLLRLEAMLSSGELVADLTMQKAKSLASSLEQTIASTMLGDGTPRISFYSPRVLIPSNEKKVILVINGPNLSKADIQAKSDAQLGHINIFSSQANQVVLEITRDQIPFSQESKLFNIRIHYSENNFRWYKRWTWRPERRKESDLLLWLLPEEVASYNITTRISKSDPERKIEPVDLGSFKGRDTEIDRHVAVPGYNLDWRLDIERKNEIELVQGGADNGRCEGIRDHTITANGLTMYARVDKTKHLIPKDAWVNCSIKLPLIRERTVEVDGPSKTGRLLWLNDSTFDIPRNLVSQTITVKDFRGEERVFRGAGVSPNGLYRILAGGGALIIRATQPSDF